jgi:tripartite-type tricarboxylate transporter receptor subunit TctC
MMAPASTPADVLAKLHAALVEAGQDPKFREDIERLGAEVTTMTPQDSRIFLERESAVWTPIVRRLNATPN